MSEVILVGAICLIPFILLVAGSLWHLRKQNAELLQKNLEMSRGAQDMMSEKGLAAVLDRVLAKSPQEQHGRMRTSAHAEDLERRRQERAARQETRREREEKLTGQVREEPKRRRQPRSHAHIPMLARFENVQVNEVEGVAKCWSTDGHSSIERIPLEVYWQLVDDYEESEEP